LEYQAGSSRNIIKCTNDGRKELAGMNEIDWLELFLALIGLIGWCILVLKLVDGWANRQYQNRIHQISIVRTLEMNLSLLEKLQSNLEAVIVSLTPQAVPPALKWRRCCTICWEGKT
jgi:hypothetical protein